MTLQVQAARSWGLRRVYLLQCRVKSVYFFARTSVADKEAPNSRIDCNTFANTNSRQHFFTPPSHFDRARCLPSISSERTNACVRDSRTSPWCPSRIAPNALNGNVYVCVCFLLYNRQPLRLRQLRTQLLSINGGMIINFETALISKMLNEALIFHGPMRRGYQL